MPHQTTKRKPTGGSTHLAAWSAENNLLLNTSKSKELIVFRRKTGDMHNPTHQRAGCWRSSALSSWGPHLWWPVLVYHHLQPGEEGPPVPLLIKDTEEETPVFSYPVEPLPRCDWGHSYHLCKVWWEEALSATSSHHSEGLLSPCTQTFCPLALWQANWKPLDKD